MIVNTELELVVGAILNYTGRTSVGFNEESGLCKVVRKCNKNEDSWIVKMIVSNKTYSAPRSRLSSPEEGGRGHRKRTSLTQSDQDSTASDTQSTSSSPSSTRSSVAGKRQKTNSIMNSKKLPLTVTARKKRSCNLDEIRATENCTSAVALDSLQSIAVKKIPPKQKKIKLNAAFVKRDDEDFPPNTPLSGVRTAGVQAQSRHLSKPVASLSDTITKIGWKALSETVKPPSPLWQLIPIPDPKYQISKSGVVVKEEVGKDDTLWPSVDDEVKVIFSYQDWRAGRVTAYNDVERVVSVCFYDDGTIAEYCYPHRDIILYKVIGKNLNLGKKAQRNGGKPIYTSQSTATDLSLESIVQDPLSLLYVQFSQNWGIQGDFWGTIVDVVNVGTTDVRRLVFKIMWDDGSKEERVFSKLFGHLNANRIREQVGLNGADPDVRIKEVDHNILEDLSLTLQKQAKTQPKPKASSACARSLSQMPLQQRVSKNKAPRTIPDNHNFEEKENVSDRIGSQTMTTTTATTAVTKKKPIVVSKLTCNAKSSGSFGVQKGRKDVLKNRSGVHNVMDTVIDKPSPPLSLKATASPGSSSAVALNKKLIASQLAIEEYKSAAGGFLTLLGLRTQSTLENSKPGRGRPALSVTKAQMTLDRLADALDKESEARTLVSDAVFKLTIACLVLKDLSESPKKSQSKSQKKIVSGVHASMSPALALRGESVSDSNTHNSNNTESCEKLMSAAMSLKNVILHLRSASAPLNVPQKTIDDALDISQKALSLLENKVEILESREEQETKKSKDEKEKGEKEKEKGEKKPVFGSAITNLVKDLGVDCPNMGIYSYPDVLLKTKDLFGAINNSTAIRDDLMSSSLHSSSSSSSSSLFSIPRWKPMSRSGRSGNRSLSQVLSHITDSNAPVAAIRATLSCALSGHSVNVTSVTIRGMIQSALDTVRKILSTCEMKKTRWMAAVNNYDDGKEGNSGDEGEDEGDDSSADLCAKVNEISPVLEQLRANRSRIQAQSSSSSRFNSLGNTQFNSKWLPTTEQVSEFIQMATTAISGLHFSMHIAQDRHRLQCVQLHAEALRCCSEVLQFTDQAIAFNTTTSKATVTATMSGVDSTTSTGLMECNDLDVSTAKPSSSSSLSSSIMNDVETSFKCVARDAVKLIRTHAYLISRFTEPRFVIHSRGEKLSLCSAGVSASAHSSTHAGADTGASAPSSSHIYSLSYPQSHSYHAVLGAVGIVNSLGNILILQGKEKERDAEGKQETLTGGTESSSEYRQELLFLKNSCTEAVKSTPVYVRLPSTGIKGSVAVGAVLSSRPAAAVVDMDSSCICSDGLSLAWMLPQMQTAVTDSGPQVLRLCILSSVIAERATYSREGSNNNDGVTRGYSGSASTVEIEKTEGMLCDHALLANIARLTIQYTL